jgi:hypothetical protein
VGVPCSGGVPFRRGDVSVTDIEGSTRGWEAEPDEMRLALAADDGVAGGD